MRSWSSMWLKICVTDQSDCLYKLYKQFTEKSSFSTNSDIFLINNLILYSFLSLLKSAESISKQLLEIC